MSMMLPQSNSDVEDKDKEKPIKESRLRIIGIGSVLYIVSYFRFDLSGRLICVESRASGSWMRRMEGRGSWSLLVLRRTSGRLDLTQLGLSGIYIRSISKMVEDILK